MWGQSTILPMSHFFRSSNRKKLLTEFYMNFTDKISVIKKKTVMSAKVLVKRSENQITGTYTTGVWKKNCRYLILWSLDQ